MPTKQMRSRWPSHVSFCVPTKFPDEVTSKFFVLDPIWRPFSPFFLPCDRPSKGSGLSELLVAQDTVKMQGIFFLQLTTKGRSATWKQKTATLRLALLTKWKICEQLTGQKITKQKFLGFVFRWPTSLTPSVSRVLNWLWSEHKARFRVLCSKIQKLSNWCWGVLPGDKAKSAEIWQCSNSKLSTRY